MRTHFCLFIAILGCGQGSAPGSSFSAVDSSGVRIATSSAPSWTPTAAWRLAVSPRMVIGVTEGPEEYEISWIWDALLLGDGTLVVGNSGSHDIRFYDGAGEFLRRAGREGAGPGEFNTMADLRMWRLPDGELAVRDTPLPRVNVFDTTGAFRRTVTLTPPDSAGWPAVIGAFADGSYLVAATEAYGEAPVGRATRSPAHYLQYDREGRDSRWILRVEMAPHMSHELGAIRHFPYLPFTVDPLVAADSGRRVPRDGSCPSSRVHVVASTLTSTDPLLR